MAFFYYFILLSRMGYHISLIPLFWLVSALCLVRRRYFPAGLFLGFLYQLHLMAAVYWPVAFGYLVFKKAPFSAFILGSFVGIIPFILTGPVQTFGVIVWLAKSLANLNSFSGASNSQLLVLFVPLVVAVSAVLSLIKARFLAVLGLIFLGFNLYYLIATRYYPPKILYGLNYGQKLGLSRQILDQSRVTTPFISVPGGLVDVSYGYAVPYDYLVWWLQRQGAKPAGSYSEFIVDENTLSLRVLE
jgi:putative effector of murein hydrolase LrgA (UPF0299 family)